MTQSGAVSGRECVFRAVPNAKVEFEIFTTQAQIVEMQEQGKIHRAISLDSVSTYKATKVSAQ